ncbi:amino acid/polyamine/organocation transporter, APC superfamily [Humidesulfovibrio mexicanus]|uniref:Amino acid/polyamine/organocation transporter, APC superfamily n=1 Tax=Humidesulfovibrio mexicanus TaxID=147047 RepID=A0A239A6B9_9BACT|nr:amino acid permease [Humidesulfovibrio mexicanus]SNR90982.1 amino acid/polyamine/organocation transporter, APC superfamily [Humidesulfovibrio mexicanus]
MKTRLAGSGGLKRELGLCSATVLVVANMVGTGVFTTSGFIMAELGDARSMLACWIVGGLFALTGALCYGELGAMLPRAGGEYAYLRRSFGPLPAFLSGWISLIVGFSAPIAAAAIAFATYFLGGESRPWFVLEFGGRQWATVSLSTVLAIGVVVALSLVHYHSLRLGQRVQNLLTAFKVVFILGLGVGGLCFGAGDATRLSSLFQGGSLSLNGGFAVALIFVSFAFSGWNAAAYLGGEIRNPERNLPRALVLGTVFVTGLYLLLNLVYVYALPVERMRGTIELGTSAAVALFGPVAGAFVGVAIALGLLSVVSAMIMAGPRVYYAMASDGLFFRCFGCVNERRSTPAQAIMFQAGIAIVMILSASFDGLLVYIGFTLSLSSMLTVAGLLRLRFTEPGLPRPYRTLGYPITPLVFICGNLWIVAHSLFSRPVIALYGVGTILVGVGLYRVFRPSMAERKEWEQGHEALQVVTVDKGPSA